ncbi:MAG: hypothetical protein HY089_06685, partial [Ignavibacteriales bacterium]|nr:hypothetical protein [Ignavibacteriales bacterium]
MKIFFRLLTYFIKYKWRIALGLFSVVVMSLSDAVSAFLIAQLFEVLQKIGDLVKAGQPIFVDVPIEVFGVVL